MSKDFFETRKEEIGELMAKMQDLFGKIDAETKFEKEHPYGFGSPELCSECGKGIKDWEEPHMPDGFWLCPLCYGIKAKELNLKTSEEPAINRLFNGYIPQSLDELLKEFPILVAEVRDIKSNIKYLRRLYHGKEY
jgi:hypothetical protein